MNGYNIDSNLDSFNNRILTVKRSSGKEVRVHAHILYTLPMVHLTDDVLELRKIDYVLNRTSDKVTIGRYTRELPSIDIVKPTDGITYKENGNFVVDENGDYINNASDKNRFKVLQIAKGVASNKETMIIYDRKYSDIIVIPNLEYVNCESWNVININYVKGYRIGTFTPMGDDLLKNEYLLTMNEADAVKIDEPISVTSETLLIDAYGLHNGDAGNHYNDYVYYEKTQEHNGVPVNYGITRCQTQPIGLICLGTVGELYPGGLNNGLPLYSLSQPFTRFYSLSDLGVVKPTADAKVYFILDI